MAAEVRTVVKQQGETNIAKRSVKRPSYLMEGNSNRIINKDRPATTRPKYIRTAAPSVAKEPLQTRLQRVCSGNRLNSTRHRISVGDPVQWLLTNMYHGKTLTKRDIQVESTKTSKMSLTQSRRIRKTKSSHINKWKTAYHIRASIGIDADVLRTTNCLLDTAAQPIIVSESFLPASQMKEARKEHSMNLCSATNDSSSTLGQIKFYLILCDLHAKAINSLV